MSTVETIEYFANCPSCGAANDGSGVCSYCGASLVKSKRVTESLESAEDVIAREDAALPTVEAKSGEVSGFLKLFCPLFGGMFILIPTALFLIFLSTDIFEFWLIPFFSIFWIIGFGSLVPLLTAYSRRRKCLKGHHIVGIVRGYENGNAQINDQPVKSIRVRVEDGTPRIVVIDTGDTKCRYPVGTKIALMTDGTCFLIEGVA